MRCELRLRAAGLALVVFAVIIPCSWAQHPIGMGFRGPAVPPSPAAPQTAGAPGSGGASYGGYSPYVGVFAPYQNAYGGMSAAAIASVPSAAYLNLGTTSYTTESPLPIYGGPRMPYAPLPPPTPLTALLKVQVPRDAEIWLEGRPMRSAGAVRHYRSPPLNPAKGYVYEVRARWTFDGKPVEDVRQVAIRAGAVVLVDFTHLDPLIPRPSLPKDTPKSPPASSDDAASADKPTR